MFLILTCINTCNCLIIKPEFKLIKLICFTKLSSGHLKNCVQTDRHTHRRHNKPFPLSHSLPPKGLCKFFVPQIMQDKIHMHTYMYIQCIQYIIIF